MDIETETESTETDGFASMAEELTEATPEVTEEAPETSEGFDQGEETSEEPNVDEPEVAQEEEPEEEGFPKRDNEKDHEAFAKLRVERNRYESVIARLAQREGLSIEDYEAKVEQDEMAAEAAEKEVPVEFLERLKELEHAEEVREREHQASRFRTNIERFQNKHDLSEPQLRGFIDTCFDNGIDLTTAGIDLNILYRGLYHDDMVENERQKWITKDKENRNSTSSTGQGKGSTPKSQSGGTIDKMSDLDALIKNINN